MPFISEVLPNPKGSDRGTEWIELGNSGTAAVPLGGWFLKDASGKTLALRGEIPPGGFFVIGPADLGLSLNNTAETLFLMDRAGNVRDSVSWSVAPSGESFARNGEGFLWTKLLTPGAANRIESAMFEDRLLLAQEGALLGPDGMGMALGFSLAAGLAAVFLAQYFFRHLNDNEAR